MSVCQHFFEKNIALSSSSCEHRGKAAPGGVKASLEKATDQPGSPSGSPYKIKEDASLLQNQHLPLVGVFDLILFCLNLQDYLLFLNVLLFIAITDASRMDNRNTPA